MAFDGVTISNIIYELKEKIIGGRIDKIYQPENDEIIMSIRNFGNTYKLLLTANASNPRIHFTAINKDNPAQPPLFCMVMRKHIVSGKIIDIVQPDFERIVNIYIESINELGDYSTKKLILEIMGRHSNLILTDENDIILDAIKHITHDKSSVREVLSGKKYVLPPSKNKYNTIELNKDNFLEAFNSKINYKIQEIIYKSYNGISPIMASEICNCSKLNPALYGKELNNVQIDNLYVSFHNLVDKIKSNIYNPEIIFDDKGKVIEFSSIEMTQYNNYNKQKFESISELLEFYYKNRDVVYRMNQKSQDLKKLIQQNIERCVKKKNIQIKTLKEISNREKYKLYGELITANIYSIQKGMTMLKTQNFYDNNCSDIEIPLDSNLTPSENAQKYFKKYNKEKRTFAAVQIQMKQNDEELKYLESVLSSVQNSVDEQDIREVRQELAEQGFIKKSKNIKSKHKNIKKSKPLHFKSSDGFDIYIGKNNKQNDELTLRFAKPHDIWLHTKDIPGSHVIIVTDGKNVPERTLNEAAMLAAFYSKGKNSSLVPIDYTVKKNVKKPSGAKPGMVIYESNKTAYITPSEDYINKIKCNL